MIAGGIAMIGLLMVGIAPGGDVRTPSAASDRLVMRQFEQSIREYMTLRATATRALPPLESSEDVGKIQRTIEAHAAAVRAARSGARAGELFTPTVAAAFRRRVREVLAVHGYTGAELRQMMADEDEDQAMPPLEVNGRFPWEAGTGMTPCVLAALPPLPRGLEYRFVRRSLVLVDLEASLVVDVLPDVLPD